MDVHAISPSMSPPSTADDHTASDKLSSPIHLASAEIRNRPVLSPEFPILTPPCPSRSTSAEPLLKAGSLHADSNGSGIDEDDHDEGMGQDSPKKKRARTSPEQLRILQKAFLTDPMPSATVRLALANRLGMTSRAVQVWFQNRRAKGKLDIKRMDQQVALFNYHQAQMPVIPFPLQSHHSAQSYNMQGMGVPMEYGEATHIPPPPHHMFMVMDMNKISENDSNAQQQSSSSSSASTSVEYTTTTEPINVPLYLSHPRWNPPDNFVLAPIPFSLPSSPTYSHHPYQHNMTPRSSTEFYPSTSLPDPIHHHLAQAISAPLAMGNSHFPLHLLKTVHGKDSDEEKLHGDNIGDRNDDKDLQGERNFEYHPYGKGYSAGLCGKENLDFSYRGASFYRSYPIWRSHSTPASHKDSYFISEQGREEDFHSSPDNNNLTQQEPMFISMNPSLYSENTCSPPPLATMYQQHHPNDHFPGLSLHPFNGFNPSYQFPPQPIKNNSNDSAPCSSYLFNGTNHRHNMSPSVIIDNSSSPNTTCTIVTEKQSDSREYASTNNGNSRSPAESTNNAVGAINGTGSSSFVSDQHSNRTFFNQSSSSF